MSQNPQSTSTEEQRAEVQAKMSAIKAQIADLQAKIEATRITSDLEQGRTTRQGKSK
jgi:hypothetical protein